MSEEKTTILKSKEVSVNHLCYLGSVLSESIKDLHVDLLNDPNKPASAIICSPSFSRIIKLTESLEEAIKLCFTFFK